MMCGMAEDAAWASCPGKLLDIYLWRQEYDDQLHGITRGEEDMD